MRGIGIDGRGGLPRRGLSGLNGIGRVRFRRGSRSLRSAVFAGKDNGGRNNEENRKKRPAKNTVHNLPQAEQFSSL